MRRFLSLRWLGLHAAMVVIVAGFLWLGWWQLHRAEGGNALSWGYTFEWPLFAGFVVFFWIKVMRDELSEARQREAEPAGMQREAEPAGVTLPVSLRPVAGSEPGSPPRERAVEHESDDARGPDGTDEDEELAAYNAYLSRLNAEASRTAGQLSGRAGLRQSTRWAWPRPAPGGATRPAADGATAAGPAADRATGQQARANPPHLEV